MANDLDFTPGGGDITQNTIERSNEKRWIGVVLLDQAAPDLKYSYPPAESTVTTPPAMGPLVDSVFKDGPADSAGIVAGDQIVEIDGAPIDSAERFSATLQTRAIGEIVALMINRDNTQILIKVKVGIKETVA